MIVTFEIDIAGGRGRALDVRDEIIDVLESEGYRLVLTDDGTHVRMQEED